MTCLKPGDKAPDFEGVNQDEKTVNLKMFSGKKLIIFFYPKDNTPGCTAQACNLRDNYSDLVDSGYEVIGVSADSAKSHKKFIAKQNLPYSLIADSEKVMLNAYNVWGEKKFMGRTYDGIHRTTFVIDENGIISDIITKVKTKAHYEQIVGV